MWSRLLDPQKGSAPSVSCLKTLFPASLSADFHPRQSPCERLSLSHLLLFRCVQQLKNDGFHVDELFQKCLFEEDEKEKVLRAIRVVQPNYQLPPPPKPETCKSSLLQDFYSKVSHKAQGCLCSLEQCGSWQTMFTGVLRSSLGL